MKIGCVMMKISKKVDVYLKLRWLLEVIVIIILLPVLLFVILFLSLLLIYENKGRIFYFQRRIGKNKKPFTLIKFRTMNGINDNDPPELKKKKMRISRLGRFFRKHRLDEIPQFFNILAGQMSLIGPRPEEINLYNKYLKKLPNYSDRTCIRQGLTGWAQVNTPHTQTINGTKAKFAHDIYYIQNISISLDIKIIFRTVITMFYGNGGK